MSDYTYKNDYDERIKRNERMKKNQEDWKAAYAAGDTEAMKRAHDAQVSEVASWDKKFGGISGYDSETGTWSLSDGQRTDANGVTGNSVTEKFYNRDLSRNKKDYDTAYNAYRASEFSYNPETDEDFLAYKRAYEKAGRQAMDDTIAKSAAKTGGMASSYAATAGALAYQDYMDALSDKIPELKMLAYEKFKDEQDRYLKEMELAENQMDKEEDMYDKNRAAYLEEIKNNEALEKSTAEKKIAYDSAMIKAQTEGFSALTDSEREVIYGMGSYYDPEREAIINSSGDAYATKGTSEDEAMDASAALLKFRYKGTGISALTNADIKALYSAGYSFNGTSWISPSGEVISPILKTSSKTSASSTSKKSASEEKKTDTDTGPGQKEEEKPKETVNINGVDFTKRKYMIEDEEKIKRT